MKNESIAFGIDIGGTNTKIGIFTKAGELLAYRKVPTLKEISAADFIDHLARECCEELEKIQLKLGDPRIIGVGAGAPMANYFTGSVEFAPNLGWKNVPLKSLFEKSFKCPAVIENDANLAAVGEKKWGSGKNFTDFILITLGTGVGTGLVFNGRLYRGNGALGAEGGHVLIPHTKNRRCSCGGYNHLESYLSAQGIKDTIKELSGEDWPLEVLGEKFAQKDPKTQVIISQIASELALGLASMGVLFGPEAFIIGGGVSQLGQEFNQAVQKKLEEYIHFSLRNKIKILTATLSSGKGAIYGGAAHILDEVSK